MTLRTMRKRAKLSQGALAAAARVHRRNLIEYERGGLVPSRPVADRLAGALGVEAGTIWPKYRPEAR